jgi:hypothetical protein
MKFKYSQHQNVTCTTGIVNDYQFRLNSIFDPDLSGTGHQPYGYDTFATLYNRYRVFKCDYDITIVNQSTGPATTTVLCCNNATAFTNATLASESTGAVTKVLTGSAALSTVHFRGSVDLPSLTGQTPTQYMAEDRYQAVFSQNPSELMTLNVCNTTLTANGTLSIIIDLIYTCECFDPLDLAQS